MARMAAMSGSVDALKKALRAEVKQKLNNMTQEERVRESRAVTEKLLNSEAYQRSKYVSVYLSMDEEVDTRPILHNIFDTGRVCYIPYYTKDTMKMLRLASIQDYESLPLTRWNIKQPADDTSREDALTAGTLDLLIVPGLAFGTKGERLGRGRAYYDKFMTKCAQHTQLQHMQKVGLAFSAQLCPNIPMSDTDYWLDNVFFP
eukprot:comp124571_c0_seq1/m.49076 comp124571_c0_seq1/g.49076  ORF comp124571_c0_seq1/g.49076 comp124571_c0_seq1/m.49076 type:complete len:203 (-) comp124571_c0_seq1:28-636(-)